MKIRDNNRDNLPRFPVKFIDWLAGVKHRLVAMQKLLMAIDIFNLEVGFADMIEMCTVDVMLRFESLQAC